MKVNLISKVLENINVGDFIICESCSGASSTYSIFKLVMDNDNYRVMNLDNIKDSIFYTHLPLREKIIEDLIVKFDFDIIDHCKKENVEINFKLN